MILPQDFVFGYELVFLQILLRYRTGFCFAGLFDLAAPGVLDALDPATPEAVFAFLEKTLTRD